MSLIERVQAILLKPKQTWPVIASESGDAASLYSRYIVILAAIPAIASFIGLAVLGVGGFGVTVRLPIVSALGHMLVSYALTLVLVYVLALIVDALAPTFGGTKNRMAALKVVAYSMTAVWVAGILGVLPALGALAALVGLVWTVYLLYTGLPVLMRTPVDKAGAYTAVVIVCGIVAGLVVGAVSALFLGGAGMGMGGRVGSAAIPDVTIRGADGSNVTINGAGMADMAKRMEEAGKRMEQAQKSGDNAAAGKAMGDILGAVTGSGNTAPIASADLKAMLPDALGELTRKSVEAQSGQAMGIGGSSARATYAAGDKQVELSITDSGGLAGLATMAGWANLTMDKETDGKVEKVYKDGARTVREEYSKDGSHGEMTVILTNGIIVEADGRRVDMAALKKVVAGIDFAKIEALKRAAK